MSLNALFSQLFSEPMKLGIVGSGCSVATEPTAEVSHYFNLTQVSNKISFLSEHVWPQQQFLGVILHVQADNYNRYPVFPPPLS